MQEICYDEFTPLVDEGGTYCMSYLGEYSPSMQLQMLSPRGSSMPTEQLPVSMTLSPGILPTCVLPSLRKAPVQKMIARTSTPCESHGNQEQRAMSLCYKQNKTGKQAISRGRVGKHSPLNAPMDFLNWTFVQGSRPLLLDLGLPYMSENEIQRSVWATSSPPLFSVLFLNAFTCHVV